MIGDADIYKKPEPSSIETFFHLSYSAYDEDALMEVLNKLNTDTDRELITVIFKKSKFHRTRVLAGKLLYYTRF